jgi:hypothetical protein
MQIDPRLVRWLKSEQRQFWLFHGGSFVVGCGVGVALLLLAFGPMLLVSSGYGVSGGRALRGGAAMILLAAAWVVLLWRWAAWLWADGLPLARLDPVAGARALGMLLGSEAAVPCDVLARAVGADDIERLGHLRGVVRLAGPPAALSLAAPLRAQLAFAASARMAYEARAGGTRPVTAPVGAANRGPRSLRP